MMNKNFELIKGDIRDKAIVKNSLEGIDAVVHLAAIVGDPACKKYSEEANETNWLGSVNLFTELKPAESKDLFLPQHAVIMEKMDDKNSFVDEKSELNPVSLYAELKVKFEKFLMSNKNSKMISTALRFLLFMVFTQNRFDRC